jgi:hypothetical protein
MDGFKAKLAEVAKENGRDLDKAIEHYGSLEKVITKGYVPVSQITEALKRMAGVNGEASASTGDMTAKLEEFQNVVDKVWAGDFGNGEDRVRALTDAGYEYAKIQDLVNKSADGYRLTLEDLSDTQLEAIGYTKEEITQLRELAKQAEETGTPINELINSLTKKSGRELLLESIMNAINGVIKVCSTLKDAWRDIFPPLASDSLYNVIEGINAFSQKLIISDESAEKLRRTFRGLFALIDVVSTILNAGFKIGLEVVNAILSYFNLDILDVTASVGDMLVKFRDWVDNTVDIKAAVQFLMPYVEKAIKKIVEFGKAIGATDIGSKLMNFDIKGVLTSLMTWAQEAFTKIKALFGDGTLDLKQVGETLVECGKSLITKLLDGISDGITVTIPKAKDKITGIFTTIKEFISRIDFGNVAAGFIIGGVLHTINKMSDSIGSIGEALGNITAPFKAMGEAITGLGKIMGKYVKAKAFKTNAEGILKIALAIAVLAGAVYVLAKVDANDMWRAVGALGVLAAIIIALVLVMKVLTKNPVDTTVATDSLLKIAGCLAIVAIALKAMSGIENIKNAAIGMGIAVVALLIMMYAMENLVVKAKSMESAGDALLKIAIALGIMTFVVKMAAKIGKAEAKRGLTVIGMVGLLFVAAIAVSKLAGEHGSSAGSMLLKMSIAMGIMVFVVKLASRISAGEVRKATKTLWLIEGLFLAAIAVSKLAGANGKKAGSMLLKMSIAMLIMVGVVKLIAGTEQSDVDKGIEFIKRVGTMFTIFMGVSRLAGGNAAKAGIMFIGLGIALMAMVGAVYLLSFVKEESIKKAIDAISQFMLMLSVVVAASHFAGDAKGSIIAIGIVIAILAAALVALSFIKPEKLQTSVAALSTVMLALAAVLYSAKGLENVKIGKIIVTFIMMGVLMGVAAVIIGQLSKMNSENAVPNTIALSALLLAMAGSLLIISKMGSMSWGDVARAGAMMGGLVVILEGLTLVLATMNGLGVQASMGNVAALVILLAAMTIVTIALSRFMGNMSWKDFGIAMLSMAALAGVMELLALVLATMTALHVDNAITNATALTILLGAMAVAMIPMGLIGKLGPTILIGVGAMAILAVVMELLALVLATMTALHVDNAITNATALAILMGALAIAVIPMGLLGTLGPTILIGAGAMAILAVVMELLALVLATMSALKIQNGIDNAIALGILVIALSVAAIPLGLLGTLGPTILWGAGLLAAIAAVIGLAIKAFQEFIAPGLPEMGKQLSEFMWNLVPAILVAKTIDDSAVEGCKNIASMLLALAGAGVTDAIMSFFGGDDWVSGIGETLSEFGDAMVEFSNKLTEGNFNAENVNAAANAGNMLAGLYDALPRTGGAVGDAIASVMGTKDAEAFGEEMVSFGTSMAEFSETVKDIDPAAVESAANAGKMLAEMNKTIPNSGGKLAEWLGDNTMDTFGTQLVVFGESLSAFSKSITGENAIDTEAVAAAAEAGTALADMANEIPNEGGWLAKIVGDNTIDTWGDKLPKFGEGLKGFSDSIQGIDGGNVKDAAEAGKALAEMAHEIPNEGGWISKIIGDNSLDTFADNIGKLGTGMKTFSATTEGIKPENIEKAVAAAEDINDVIANLPSKDAMNKKIDEKGIQKLDQTLPSLLTTLSVASQTIAAHKIDTAELSEAVTNLQSISNTLVTMGKSEFSGIDNFVTAINDLGTVSVEKFTQAFKEGSPKAEQAAKNMVNNTKTAIDDKGPKFKTSGSNLMLHFIAGVSTKKMVAQMTVLGLVSAMKNTITSCYSAFKSAGGYLIDGLASGISSAAYKAAQAASAAMVSAVNAAKEAAGINSPSKVFYEMGEFTIAGFVNALDDLGGTVYNAGHGMADNARKGFSNAISRITSAFDEDSMQPTIRPVLDLSSVEAGAGTIGRMFNMTPSVGLMSDVSAISSMMANRQNGVGNGDVVSAIDKLRRELGNAGGTTNNYINGVTYDDGSNVSDAVATLVRAARIERRR